MQLYSISFLFYFLPLFLGVYYIVPDKEKTLVTIIGSVIFFLLQDGTALWQLILILVLIGVVYLLGTELCKQKRVSLLWAALGAMAALLVFFKCWQGGKLLPPGMSFYIFQMAAYLIDVHQRRLDPEKSLVSFGGQILLFPKLLSGPLMVPRSIQAQMNHPRVNLHRFHAGFQELIVGLAMKVLLADRLVGLWSQAAVVGYDSISPLFAWTALAAFAMRLYYDFHGYSMIAVGLGKMMGFELPRNFDDPYASTSVSEFFRRWHITLGVWFRDYVYIPLGGNKKGTWRMVMNLLAVWVLTGLWHGVGGNYLIWAMFLAVLIISEKLWLGKVLRRIGIGAHIYTVGAILLSWVPFAIGQWDQMLLFLSQLFGYGGGLFGSGQFLRYLPVFLPAVLFLTPLPGRLFDRYREKIWFDAVLFALFWISIYFVATAKQDPFLYFQF